MRLIHPIVKDGLCYIRIVNNQNGEIILDDTRDMGSVIDVLGGSALTSETLANEAFEYLTGHRCPQCRNATNPRLICRECGVCPHCCVHATQKALR